MKFIKKNLKVIISFIVGVITTSGIVYAAISAREVNYTRSGTNITTVEEALNDLYEKSINSNSETTCAYVTDDIKDVLDAANKRIEMSDIITNSLMNRISDSKQAAKKVMDHISFRNSVSEQLLSALKVSLVPTLSNNSNVLYSTQYSDMYAGYIAFRSSGYWCTESGKQNNAYIGYNFNKDVNVRIAKFYNGDGNDYRCRQVKLQCSSDNVTWKDASEVYTFENASKVNFLFNTKEDDAYQYWRLYIINSHNVAYSGLRELQFYGI